MKRILLVEDDADHELLLDLAARDAGGQIVARISNLEDLRAAIAEHDPDGIVLDIWLGERNVLSNYADILAAAEGRPVVLWTHDPWAVRDCPEAARAWALVDKLAPRSDLIDAIARA